MSFEIKPATRQGVRPLIGLYSESGNGKTYSSLLLARGFVGPAGKIVLADTESGRGSLYADVLPGGYQTLALTEPFSPARYMEAVKAIEESGAGIGILDSGSHEWEGLNGVLDMAVAEEARGMKGLGVWKKPKMEHAKFMLCLLQSPIPWIVCLRAKYKSRQVKGAVIKDDHTTPIQAEDFIFEMTVHAEILPDHKLNVSKCSHPDLRKVFTGAAITIQTGAALAQWCNAAGAPAPSPKRADGPSSVASATSLKKRLWELTVQIHENSTGRLQQWLWDEALISDTETLSKLTAERLIQVIEAAEKKLQPA